MFIKTWWLYALNAPFSLPRPWSFSYLLLGLPCHSFKSPHSGLLVLSATKSSTFSSLPSFARAPWTVFLKNKSEQMSPAPRALWLSAEVPEPLSLALKAQTTWPYLLCSLSSHRPLLTTGGSSAFLLFSPILPLPFPPGVGGVFCFSQWWVCSGVNKLNTIELYT